MHAVGAYLFELVFACVARTRLSALGLRPALILCTAIIMHLNDMCCRMPSLGLQRLSSH